MSDDDESDDEEEGVMTTKEVKPQPRVRVISSSSSGEGEEEDPEPPKFKLKTEETKKNAFPTLITKEDMKDSDEEGDDEDKKLARDLKATAAKRVPGRPHCPFGATCYRKNPIHREEEAHPGDEDYEVDEVEPDVDEDDNRPECEYGLNCYRKNPQHKRDFKHTRKPNPKRRAKQKKTAVDDEDHDDYESSFIDDESVEDISHDEESEEEWIPTDDED